MVSIDEWWPELHQEIRRWMVNNFWSPVAEFSVEEIARLGGPGRGGQFRDQRDGELSIPTYSGQLVIPQLGPAILPIRNRDSVFASPVALGLVC